MAYDDPDFLFKFDDQDLTERMLANRRALLLVADRLEERYSDDQSAETLEYWAALYLRAFVLAETKLLAGQRDLILPQLSPLYHHVYLGRPCCGYTDLREDA